MRMLIRVFGITVYATATIVSVFMGGLALGSWVVGRWSLRIPQTLKLFGIIEVGIALMAGLVTLVLKYLPFLYVPVIHWLPAPHPGETQPMVLFIKWAIICVVLLGPTFLMGGTLPLLNRWISTNNQSIGSKLAILYGVNTLGAVLGVLFTGFVAIALWGEIRSVGIAIVIDLLIGLFILWSPASRQSAKGMEQTLDKRKPKPLDSRVKFYLMLALASGFCALAYEIIWTRILILVMGSSVYAFSGMLSLYLLGISIGSLIISKTINRMKNPRFWFGVFQIVLAFIGCISLYSFRALGLSTLDWAYLNSPITGVHDFLKILLMGGAIVVPVTIILGVLFPIMGKIVTPDFKQAGQTVGTLYSLNTLGGVLGALTIGFFLIPALGTQVSFSILCLINFLIGFLILIKEKTKREIRFWSLLFGASLIFLFILPLQSDFFFDTVARRLKKNLGNGEILFHQEDRAATITGFTKEGWENQLLINGIMVSGKGNIGDFMAHLPLLLHPHPTRALVVCLGAGNTFRAAVKHIEKVDVVELVKGVVDSFSVFYHDANNFLNDPGVDIYINDGRQFLLTSQDHYDTIIVDASPPIYSAGTVNLYSLEFLKLSKKRLSEKGIMVLWVPLSCFKDDFWMIAKNFKTLFQHMRIWTLPRPGGVLLLGSDSKLDLSSTILMERLRDRELLPNAPWLTKEFIDRGNVLSEKELGDYAESYPNVTDDRPFTEFPLIRFLKGEKLWKKPLFLLEARQSSKS